MGGLGGVVQGKGYVPRVFDRRMADGESDWQRQPLIAKLALVPPHLLPNHSSLICSLFKGCVSAPKSQKRVQESSKRRRPRSEHFFFFLRQVLKGERERESERERARFFFLQKHFVLFHLEQKEKGTRSWLAGWLSSLVPSASFFPTRQAHTSLFSKPSLAPGPARGSSSLLFFFFANFFTTLFGSSIPSKPWQKQASARPPRPPTAPSLRSSGTR